MDRSVVARFCLNGRMEKPSPYLTATFSDFFWVPPLSQNLKKHFSYQEKVRYVKFDAMGHHLITGIANLTTPRTGTTATTTSTSGTDRLMWVRTSGLSDFAADHLYGGSLLYRRRNDPEVSMPRFDFE